MSTIVAIALPTHPRSDRDSHLLIVFCLLSADGTDLLVGFFVALDSLGLPNEIFIQLSSSDVDATPSSAIKFFIVCNCNVLTLSRGWDGDSITMCEYGGGT